MCGVVLEPLTLWVEILAVAVIDADVFDTVFAAMVDVNEEGSAVSAERGNPLAGVPFSREWRERLVHAPLSPVARALLELAWAHRASLLAG